MSKHPIVDEADRNRRIAAVQAALTEEGANRPIPGIVMNGDNVMLTHSHLTGTFPARVGLPLIEIHDGQRFTAFGRMNIAHALGDIARRQTRARDMETADIPLPEIDERGRSKTPVPAWTIIAHPLYAYAIARLTNCRMDFDPSTYPEASVEHDIAIGGIWIGRQPRAELTGNELRASASCHSCKASIARAIPQTVALSLSGRLFTEIAELPPVGLARIDDAVSRLTISRVGISQGPPASPHAETRFYLKPTSWVPLADPPAGTRRTFDLAHRYIR